MKKVRVMLILALFAGSALTSITGCKKAEIEVDSSGDDGDVTGKGGSSSDTHDWENSKSRSELNMDITSGDGKGSFQIIVEDPDGKEVLNETLKAGVGDDSKTVCSSKGTPGTWSVTVKLSDFEGDGSFTLDQGC